MIYIKILFFLRFCAFGSFVKTAEAQIVQAEQLKAMLRTTYINNTTAKNNSLNDIVRAIFSTNPSRIDYILDKGYKLPELIVSQIPQEMPSFNSMEHLENQIKTASYIDRAIASFIKRCCVSKKPEIIFIKWAKSCMQLTLRLSPYTLEIAVPDGFLKKADQVKMAPIISDMLEKHDMFQDQRLQVSVQFAYEEYFGNLTQDSPEKKESYNIPDNIPDEVDKQKFIQKKLEAFSSTLTLEFLCGLVPLLVQEGLKQWYVDRRNNDIAKGIVCSLFWLVCLIIYLQAKSSLCGVLTCTMPFLVLYYVFSYIYSFVYNKIGI